MRSKVWSIMVAAAMAVAPQLAAAAAPPTRTLGVDLNPLIDKAAPHKEQFAVEVPHNASVLADGTWASQGTTTTWTYRVRIPTAVSLSLRASGVTLPPSAVVMVTGGRGSARYTARDLSRNTLLTRPLLGDALTITITVATAEAADLRLQVDSLQAGYRVLGRGGQGHPHYLALQKAATATSSCSENYQCHVDAINTDSSHATVAVVVGNLYECTGTLLNDTRQDGIPYVLTARHCQSGQLMGGNPDVANQVTIYWNEITSCGATIGSLYDGATPAQTGATTVVEQQDAWLLRLDAPPAFAGAFFAGWNISGTPINGGYSIHHALGLDQQYVAWQGTSVNEVVPGTALGITYDSSFIGVVNGVGSVSAGASGGALFNSNGLVVGSSTLARMQSGSKTEGVCPASPVPAPSASTATALYTSLAGVWRSTADATSSTGSRTLQSVLDATNSGVTQLAGTALQPLSIQAVATFAAAGDLVTINWSAPGASSCTAWGGESGDGWAGPRAASGSALVSSQNGGTLSYSMACTAPTGVLEGSATITWNYAAPYVFINGPTGGPMVIGQAGAIFWTATVGPCNATGGLPGDGWAGPKPTTGQVPVTVSAGVVAYTITCGSGGRSATQSTFGLGVYPRSYLFTETTSARVGEGINIYWYANGGGTDLCTTFGGSATDNWVAFHQHETAGGSARVVEDTPGTYTYTITCTGGGRSVSSSASVVVTNDPPAISLKAVAPVQQVYPAGQGFTMKMDLLWSSNVGNCSIYYTPASGFSQALILGGPSAAGASAVAETVPQTITYTLQCGSLSTTATIDWQAGVPAPILTASDTRWVSNMPYTVSWNAPAGPCTASGGAPGDGWAGSKPASGSQQVSEPAMGAYEFTLDCGSGASATTSNLLVSVPYPMAQVIAGVYYNTSNNRSQAQVTWESTIGPCLFTDGSLANPVAVSVAPKGSLIPTPAASGTYPFTLVCGTGQRMIESSTLMQVTLPTPTTLRASAATVAINSPVILSWTSDGQYPCLALGGTGVQPWLGTLPGLGSGSVTVTARVPGSVTYEVACGGNNAQVTVNYTAVDPSVPTVSLPTATLVSSSSNPKPNEAFTLTWSSTHAADCQAGGGVAGDGWSGALALSGSKSISEASAGAVTFTITCSGAPPAAAASVAVSVTSPGGGSGGSSGGGGGALGGAWLVLLLGGLALQAVARGRG